MNPSSVITEWTADSAIKHMETFIESHSCDEHLLFPTLHQKVKPKIFFSAVESFFSFEESENLRQSKYFFFGQTIVLTKDFLKSYAALSLGKKIMGYQVQLSVLPKHIDAYQARRKMFHRVSVGDIMDPEFVRCVAKSTGSKYPIFSDTQFAHNNYRSLLHVNPLFYRYHLVHFFLWNKTLR